METEVSGFTIEMMVAAVIFVVAYVLIFSEILHRTTVAIVGAVVMVGVGTALGFYSQAQALHHLDANTLLLLMAMMMLVTLLKPTGGFEYLAIRIAKLAVGSTTRLLFYLCFAVSVISMFLDNVTTVLIFAPLTVLITRLIKVNPMPYLMGEAIMSNIGGIATLIGDPPNLMIGSKAEIDFITFFIHMGPVVAVVWIASALTLRLVFHRHLGGANQFTRLELNETKAIKQPKKLKYILFALGVVIVLFFIHHYFHLYPAYVAFIGVAIAMPLLKPQPAELFGQVEWSVLMFFAGLFILVGGLVESGLLAWAGGHLADLATDPSKLLITCLALMWVAAILSAVVDNIPFTVTMIPIIMGLETHGVNIAPMWWALALGAGLGGNGTHIGATANIICVAESEHSGIPEARITPRLWLQHGLPVTVTSLVVATILFAMFFEYLQ